MYVSSSLDHFLSTRDRTNIRAVKLITANSCCALLKNYMQFFYVIFLGWVMLPHPQATSTDIGGPRTSDLSIERRRRTQFTTVLLKSQNKSF